MARPEGPFFTGAPRPGRTDLAVGWRADMGRTGVPAGVRKVSAARSLLRPSDPASTVSMTPQVFSPLASWPGSGFPRNSLAVFIPWLPFKW